MCFVVFHPLAQAQRTNVYTSPQLCPLQHIHKELMTTTKKHHKFASLFFVNFAISSGTQSFSYTHAHTRSGIGWFDDGRIRRSNWLARERFIFSSPLNRHRRSLSHNCFGSRERRRSSALIQPALASPSSFDIRSCLCISYSFFSLV